MAENQKGNSTIESAMNARKKGIKKKKKFQRGTWINLSFDDWERLEYEGKNKTEENS